MTDEFKLAEFIKLPYHDPLLEQLDRAVQMKAICTLLGPAGSGKSWLIDYWLRTRERSPQAIQPKQALYISLRTIPDNPFPVVCMVYSRLWFAIQRIDRPAYLSKRQEAGEDRIADIKVYNARQLQSLLLKVIDNADRKGIRAVVIDNAHHLDALALDWLMDTRMFYDPHHGFVPRRALILVAHNDTSSGIQLVKRLRNIEEAKAAWRYQLEMKHLSRIEFIQMLAWLNNRNLRTEFSADLNPQRETVDLWKLTGGNMERKEDGQQVEKTGARWWNIEPLAAFLDEELGPWDGKNHRIITRQVLDRVKERLGRLKD